MNNRREEILAKAVQRGFSYEDTQLLLKVSGEAELYARNRRDSIIIWGLYHGKDAIAINELCSTYRCPRLGEG